MKKCKPEIRKTAKSCIRQYDDGARFYDPVIERWNAPYPLQEDEYWAEFDKEYVQEGADEEGLEEDRINLSKYHRLFVLQNSITANNSAIHYNLSPYSYVVKQPN